MVLKVRCMLILILNIKNNEMFNYYSLIFLGMTCRFVSPEISEILLNSAIRTTLCSTDWIISRLECNIIVRVLLKDSKYLFLNVSVGIVKKQNYTL